MNENQKMGMPKQGTKLKHEKGKYYNVDLSVTLKKCALLIIDLQNDFFHDKGVYMKNGVDVISLRPKIPQCVRLSKRCREIGIPIIHIRYVLHTDKTGRAVDAGMFIEGARPWLVHEGLRAGTWGAQMIDELGTPDFDVEKNRASGFYGTYLETLLKNLKIDTLVFSGFATNICVENTYRDAWVRDFGVIGIKDAMIT
ncbi:MAG: cysteine hydrolase, partial [Desulfobacteraceae bacterium]|nr:cysteine hydrolase [Desulfobacteraceae bacterium]